MIKKICILENTKIQDIDSIKKKVKAFLKKAGKTVVEKPGKDTDLLITLGGDGTLLKGAHITKSEGTLIYGIKLGNVGFLTNKVDNLEESLQKILTGNFRISKRMALNVEIMNKKETLFKDFCLNETIIWRKAIRIVDFAGKKGGKEFLKVRADGLILSTPTGTTAHSLSAGGPIVLPEMEVIIIIPVCPYTLCSRPVVFPSEEKILINVGSDCTLICDGQREFSLTPEHSVYISKAKRKVNLIIDDEKMDFFQKLSEKFNWSL